MGSAEKQKLDAAGTTVSGEAQVGQQDDLSHSSWPCLAGFTSSPIGRAWQEAMHGGQGASIDVVGGW